LKTCSKCKIEKDESEFGKAKPSKDGLRYSCKKCEKEYKKEYYQENKEAIKEYKKEYNQNNKESIKENKKKYRQNNKESIKEYHKEYQKNNKEELKEYNKEYRKNNKEAIKEYKKEYNQNNKESIKENNKEYRKNNKDSIKEDKKEYRQENKEDIKEYQKEYRKNNKDSIKEYKKEYYQENKEDIKEVQKEYRQNNKEKRNEYQKEYQKRRKLNDPQFKIRTIVSSAIVNHLKKNGGSKNGASCLDYLPYTMAELEAHIEKQFSEPGNEWMSWENWTIYDPATYIEDDKSTWTWNLDHIAPHSTFKYDNMDCEDFQNCWALSNLRPYKAKDNISEGDRR